MMFRLIVAIIVAVAAANALNKGHTAAPAAPSMVAGSHSAAGGR